MMKIENTQFYTPEQCEDINNGFRNKGLNIEIHSENTCDNPGLRGVAKLCLNSLWGKFGQRDIMTEYTYVRSKKELAKYTTNPDVIVVNTHIIHEGLLEVHYQRQQTHHIMYHILPQFLLLQMPVLCLLNL